MSANAYHRRGPPSGQSSWIGERPTSAPHSGSHNSRYHSQYSPPYLNHDDDGRRSNEKHGDIDHHESWERTSYIRDDDRMARGHSSSRIPSCPAPPLILPPPSQPPPSTILPPPPQPRQFSSRTVSGPHASASAPPLRPSPSVKHRLLLDSRTPKQLSHERRNQSPREYGLQSSPMKRTSPTGIMPPPAQKPKRDPIPKYLHQSFHSFPGTMPPPIEKQKKDTMSNSLHAPFYPSPGMMPPLSRVSHVDIKPSLSGIQPKESLPKDDTQTQSGTKICDSFCSLTRNVYFHTLLRAGGRFDTVEARNAVKPCSLTVKVLPKPGLHIQRKVCRPKPRPSLVKATRYQYLNVIKKMRDKPIAVSINRNSTSPNGGILRKLIQYFGRNIPPQPKQQSRDPRLREESPPTASEFSNPLPSRNQAKRNYRRTEEMRQNHRNNIPKRRVARAAIQVPKRSSFQRGVVPKQSSFNKDTSTPSAPLLPKHTPEGFPIHHRNNRPKPTTNIDKNLEAYLDATTLERGALDSVLESKESREDELVGLSREMLDEGKDKAKPLFGRERDPRILAARAKRIESLAGALLGETLGQDESDTNNSEGKPLALDDGTSSLLDEFRVDDLLDDVKDELFIDESLLRDGAGHDREVITQSDVHTEASSVSNSKQESSVRVTRSKARSMTNNNGQGNALIQGKDSGTNNNSSDRATGSKLRSKMNDDGPKIALEQGKDSTNNDDSGIVTRSNSHSNMDDNGRKEEVVQDKDSSNETDGNTVIQSTSRPKTNDDHQILTTVQQEKEMCADDQENKTTLEENDANIDVDDYWGDDALLTTEVPVQEYKKSKDPCKGSKQDNNKNEKSGKFKQKWHSGTKSTPSESFDLELPVEPELPECSIEIGSRIEAMDYQGTWYPARIVDAGVPRIAPSGAEIPVVLVHFEGWSKSFDEWIVATPSRLRPRPQKTKGQKSLPRALAQLEIDHPGVKSVVAVPVGEEWECGRCTLRNASEATSCIVCNATRPRIASKVAVHAVCTTESQPTYNTQLCGVCGRRVKDMAQHVRSNSHLARVDQLLYTNNTMDAVNDSVSDSEDEHNAERVDEEFRQQLMVAASAGSSWAAFVANSEKHDDPAEDDIETEESGSSGTDDESGNCHVAEVTFTHAEMSMCRVCQRPVSKDEGQSCPRCGVKFHFPCASSFLDDVIDYTESKGLPGCPGCQDIETQDPMIRAVQEFRWLLNSIVRPGWLGDVPKELSPEELVQFPIQEMITQCKDFEVSEELHAKLVAARDRLQDTLDQ